MATNLDYNVNVNATNGIQALNNLQNKVQGLNSAFGGLRNAIAGIAIGQVIANLGKFADSISDLSDATGIAVQNILGFQKAVKAFGGDAETADKGVLKLVTSIGSAAEGSAELQYAFGRVGVTLNDLATLSEQDILRKVIRGLGEVGDTSERAILVQQLLGKEFRNVKTSGEGLSAAYDEATLKSEKNAESIKKAAEAFDNFEKAISAVKLGIIAAFQPISDFLSGLDPTEVDEFAESIGRLIAVAGGLYIFGKIATGLQALTAAAGLATIATNGLFAAFKRFLAILALVLGALFLIDKGLKAAFNISFMESVKESVMDAWNWIGELTGETDTSTAKTLKTTGDAAKETGDKVEETGKKVREVVDPFKALREQINGVAEAMGRANKANVDNINLTTSLVGVARQEAEIQKAVAEVSKKAADEIQKLTDKKAALTKEQQAGGLGAVIDKQIDAIKRQAEADKEMTTNAIKNSEARMNARKLEEFVVSSRIEQEKNLQKIQDDIAKSTMSEIQQKEYDILAAARDRAKAEIDAEEIRRGSLLTDAEKLKYYEAAKAGTEKLISAERRAYSESRTFSSGWNKAFREYIDNATNAARQAERIFQKATSGMEDLIVNFAKTGKFEWKGFVASMLEELLRSQVQNVLGSIMGSIGGIFGMGGGGDATGKGASPNDPLYVMDVSGGMGQGGMGIETAAGGEGGGIFSGITSLAGKAWDGIKNVGSGIWDGVKKVGGLISDGLGSVWDGIKTAGSTIGSIFSGTSSKYGTNAGSEQSRMLYEQDGGLFSDIADTFSGWFANGGTLGAGKWGIAGENGPEIISGPASVSPMGGTNVTYNINAVDAMSFKQMLAQDPSFIYALSLQGGGNIPSRR
jgi:lambda family phage tail tape measure protein